MTDKETPQIPSTIFKIILKKAKLVEEELHLNFADGYKGTLQLSTFVLNREDVNSMKVENGLVIIKHKNGILQFNNTTLRNLCDVNFKAEYAEFLKSYRKNANTNT